MSKMLTLPVTLVTMALAASAVTADSRADRAVREITLPAGTMLPLTLDSSVGSDISRVEDPVRAHLRRPSSSTGTPCCRRGHASAAMSARRSGQRA